MFTELKFLLLVAKSAFMVGIFTKSTGGLVKKQEVAFIRQDGSRYCLT